MMVRATWHGDHASRLASPPSSPRTEEARWLYALASMIESFSRGGALGAACILVLGLAACSDGGGVGGSGGSGGGGPAGTLADVQAIFDVHCTNCHDASKGGLPTYPSLSLVAGDTHDALVGVPADEACGGTRVVAGAPDQSYLMAKLGKDDPCSGSHMPRPFEIGPRMDLSDAELATIQSWIAAGAAP